MQSSIFIVPNKLSRKQALAVVGSLSKPSKMPCHGYSIPANKCKTGSKLRDVCNSVCSSCYALKGRYMFGNVQTALERRMQAFEHPLFTGAMASLINDLKETHFRWFDSGDLQSVAMLAQIVTIAELTPNCMHWLPTREYSIVDDYLAKFGKFPDNLIVRVSAHMVNHSAPSRFSLTSEVYTDMPNDHAQRCPSPEQGNRCIDCRACWDASVPTISYKAH